MVSPDLNSIENLGAWIKLDLHRRSPDTKRIRGGPEGCVKATVAGDLVGDWRGVIK
jgi:hypothetical protein